jgi:hypothetical protein
MRHSLCSAAVLAALAFVPAAASAGPFDLDAFQIADGSNPADKAGEGRMEEPKDGDKKDRVVVEEKKDRPSESERIGPYNAPAWSSHRRFATTRVYVQQAPGEIEFEQWVEYRLKRGKHSTPEVRFRTEFEFGLPYRFQIDLYLLTEHVRDDTDSEFNWRGISGEIRWAIADWNVIPGNPTLYFEYIVLNGEPDVIEPKILLGGDIIDRLHWGLNFIYEGPVGANHHSEQADEWSVKGGLAYGLIDNVLSVGIEANYVYNIERSRNPTTVTRFEEFYIGPSIQWRPIDQMHLDVVILRNCGNDREGKRAKIFVIFGFEF